jgi:hypothetical protein
MKGGIMSLKKAVGTSEDVEVQPSVEEVRTRSVSKCETWRETKWAPDLECLRKTALYLEYIPRSINRDELNAWIARQIIQEGFQNEDEVDVWTYYYEEVAFGNVSIPDEDKYFSEEGMDESGDDSDDFEDLDDSYASDIDEAEVLISNLAEVRADGVAPTHDGSASSSSESGFYTQ